MRTATLLVVCVALLATVAAGADFDDTWKQMKEMAKQKLGEAKQQLGEAKHKLGELIASKQSDIASAAANASAGAAAVGAQPLLAMKHHVCGLHRGSADGKHQMIAHHYCSKLPSGVMQCALFESDEPNARLIGVEYIISAQEFARLPAEEAQLWHSHVYEVKSGMVVALPMEGGVKVAPNAKPVSNEEQLEVLNALIGSFGKTIHTWNTDHLSGSIPIGAPELMVSFTEKNQTTPKLEALLDDRAGSSMEERAKERVDIAVPKLTSDVINRADAWLKAGDGKGPFFAICPSESCKI